MHRTNIVIDQDLMNSCMKATGIKTQREMVDYALRELLRKERQLQVLQLKGKVKWEGNLDEWRQGRY